MVLARRLNYRLIELAADTKGESVGILLKDGKYHYMPWLGFIPREVAARIGKPVKLRIDRIGRPRGINTDWEEVPPGIHVQGCMTERGVFAVVEDSVRLI
jgi:hypothetical protein